MERPEVQDVLDIGFSMIQDTCGLIHTATDSLGIKVFSESAFVTICFLLHGDSFLSPRGLVKYLSSTML
jgi:hypothetical protein